MAEAERYTRWRGKIAAHCWSHPSWDSELVFENSIHAPLLAEQQVLAEQYLGDNEPRDLLTFRLRPLSKAEIDREFDG